VTAVAHRATVGLPPGLANTGQIARGLVFRVGKRRQLPPGGVPFVPGIERSVESMDRVADRSAILCHHLA
jgi:hypothetical protein